MPSLDRGSNLDGSRLDRRQLLRMFGALAAVGATAGVAACAADPAPTRVTGPTGRTIQIGLVTPALGAYAKIGDDIQKGFKLYLASHNNLLGGNTVELKAVEEGPSPESAVAAVKGLLNGGILAIAGVANPAALTVLAPMMVEAKVPLICSNSCPSTLINPEYVWRASSMEGEAGRSLGAYATSQGGNAYLFYEDTTSGREEASSFRRAFTDLGGKIVGDVAGKVNFATRLATAKSTAPDVIFASHTGADAVSFLDAYRTSGITAKLIGPGSLTETADLTKLTALPQQVYTAMFYAADLDNEANRRFVSGYQKAQGVQPSSYATAAYDTAAILDKALTLVMTEPTPTDVNHALTLLGQIDSPRGLWTFNANRSPQQRWYLRRLGLDGTVAANLVDTDLTVLS